MPGGKRRLPGHFTGGMTIGDTGNYVKHILAGSVVLEIGSIGAVAGSTVCEVATITALTASHIMMAKVRVGNACTVLNRAIAGVGQASLFFSYVAGSGLAAASQTTTTVQYLAFKV